MRSVKDKDSWQEVAKLLKREKRSIKTAWHKALKRRWGRGSDAKVKFMAKEESRGKDLLSLLIKLLSGGSDVAHAEDADIIKRVHSVNYSVSDFYIEASCLEGAIVEILSRKAGSDVSEFLRMSRTVSENLSKAVVSILKTTADSYEYSLERSGSSYCQIGSDGKILFANGKMLRLLGVKSVSGRSFESFLSGENSGLIQKVLTGKMGKEPITCSMELLARRKKVPVEIELVPYYSGRQWRGTLASIVDVSAHKKLFLDVFNESPLAITRINRMGDFIYGNQKACEMCRVDHLEGHSVRELYPDRASWEIVSSQLKARFDRGASNTYEIMLTRFDKEQFPVEITTVPDRDLQGNVIGSISIYRDLSVDKLNEAIHWHIATIKNSQDLLNAVANEIGRSIPFDLFTVSFYSSDMKHVRPAFTTDVMDGRNHSDVRYRELKPNVAKWVSVKHSRYITDLEKFLMQPQWIDLRQDPAVTDLLERKLLSIYFCPIISQGRLVASVAFCRKGVSAFGPNELTVIKSLPLSECVLMAKYFEERHTLEFRLQLINEIVAASHDLKKVADIVVSRLAKHYDWEQVSIFKVDEKAKKFRLLSQTRPKESTDFALDEDYTQDIDQGVLGLAYRKKKLINISNVDPHDKLSKLYFERFDAKAKSELCIPIITDGEVRWLLDIEDSHGKAFSTSEIEDLTIMDLTVVINEVIQFLKYKHHFHVLQAALKSISDILITADNTGRIQQVDEAVGGLLDYPEEDLLGKSLGRLFVSRANFDKVMARNITLPEVKLRAKSGAEVPVLISSSLLPEELGGVVIIAKDLSTLKRLDELKYLGRMFREIALQTKLPLSLASSWLRRLRDDPRKNDATGTLDKVMQQLNKVELTYNKLALYDKKEGFLPLNRYLMDISEVVDNVLGRLPLTESKKIAKVVDAKLPPLRGDIFQLSFCLESLLSCLLRAAPQDEKVHFRVGQKSDHIVVRLGGFLPTPSEQLKVSSSDHLSRVSADLALGEKIIKNFVRNHEGRYDKKEARRHKVEFQIDLPIAQEYLP